MANPIGINIRLLRTRAGMTQEELASRMHVTRQAVSSYERGRTQPDIEQLTELADIFHVDLESLIYGTIPARNRKNKIVLAGCILLILIVCLACVLLFSFWNRKAAHQAAEPPMLYWLASTVLIPLAVTGIVGSLAFLLLCGNILRLRIREVHIRTVSIILAVLLAILLLMNAATLLAMAFSDGEPWHWFEDVCVSVWILSVAHPWPLVLFSVLTGMASGADLALRRADG